MSSLIPKISACISLSLLLGLLFSAQAEPLVLKPQDKTQMVSQQTQESLVLVDESSPTSDLIRALQHSSLKYQRKYAAEILGERKEAGAGPYLVQALQDPEDVVKKAAAESLAKIGEKSFFPQLIDDLGNPSPSVREYSAYVLGRLASKDDKEVIRALEKTAKDEDTNVRTEVIYALYEIGSPSSKDIFIAGLDDGEPRIRSYCVNALGNLRITDAGPALSSALDREKDENVKRLIVFAIGEIGGSSSAKTLAQAVTNETPSLRADIAKALGDIKTPEARSALIDLLADNNVKVRASAAASLGNLRDPAALGPLTKALKDRSVLVRRPASEALIYIADSSSIKALVDALGDSDSVVGENATEALIRVNDLDCVQDLISSLESARPAQRERVVTVLQELTHRPYGLDVDKWVQWYDENFKTSDQ